MKTYIIALKELKISDEIILKMLGLFQIEDYHELFNGNYIKLQFKYNLILDKYADMLLNKNALTLALEKAKEIEKLSKKNKIKILLINHKDYPENLKNIKNPPVVIYYKGRKFYPKHNKSIACVGTRSITDFGSGAVSSLIPNLVSEGFTIVSGLAAGVDTLSHKKCLESNGTTIAVLAHGLDTIYPKENIGLANDILKNNGLLVSEYPIGTKADKFRFVERNRLISGLSKGTIIFETKEKSGTMHTVNYAIEQSRPLFAPLPQSMSETTTPLLKLIKEGTAISIPTRNAFEVIVQNTGYRIKDKEKRDKLRNKSVSDIINTVRIDKTDLLNSVNYDDFKYASAKVNKDTYEKYKQILKNHGLSGKDMFNAFILSVVEHYNKK